MEALEKKIPEVRITFDEMEAYLLLPLVPAGQTYSYEEVMAVLNQAGVQYGIKRDTILAAIKNQTYGREILVAKGVKAVDGKDGYYDYYFNVDFNKKPTVRPDGSVDYWSIHTVEMVEKDQLIATYHEPIAGSNGFTVKGRPLTGKRGRPLPPLSGQGFSRSADGQSYTSNFTGKIEMKNDRIMISSVYEVPGNVDLQTGNINFRGDVLIHGNVTSGASIKATGNITIDGTAEGCILEAGKDIILRGGMIGGEKALIKAKGNIMAKFIEYSKVEAEGYIEASSAMNSTLVSYDRVFFSGRNATVIGGSIYGCAGIEATSFGNSSELKTEIFAGVHKKILQRVRFLDSCINESTSLIEKINAGIKQFDDMARERNIDVRNDERRIALLRTRITKQAEISSYNEELTRLKGIVERSQGAKVTVVGTVYPGVEVSINEARTKVRNQFKSVEFVLHRDKVIMIPLTD